MVNGKWKIALSGPRLFAFYLLQQYTDQLNFPPAQQIKPLRKMVIYGASDHAQANAAIFDSTDRVSDRL